ncbi:hypothetical protein CBR_g29799 [Chara braunii]|uniref:Annexin n=1 Tax=Chara braunii TaxID=69332 RepID=A0A388LBH0_CHABU|nr:hypothetical protein CBR_g29799 [Chara braunii]|eukprot:GBG79651.1 hypothetical protein CBR_g29799 [Chara braunii]
MAQHCALVFLFSLVFVLGVDAVNGGRGVDSNTQQPASVNYSELFTLLAQESHKEEDSNARLLGTPTIHPSRSFDPEEDLKTIDEALTELPGDGVGKLIKLATQRSFNQRAIVFNLYYAKTSKVLTEALASALGSSSEIFRGLEALLAPAAWRDAGYLHEAMAGAGTDDAELNEIITTRSYTQLQYIAKVYEQRFGSTLTDDIAGDSWGIVETLLIKIVTTPRTNEFATPDRVDELAQELYDAGAGRWGRDDEKFIEIFSSESYTTLRAVFHAYTAKFQTTVLDAVSSEFSRKAKDLYTTLVRVILSEPQYFADLIYTDIAGVGTNEPGLARHILARADVDLVEIKKAFLSKNKQSVSEAVQGDVSGDYLTLLLAAIEADSGTRAETLEHENSSRPVQLA